MDMMMDMQHGLATQRAAAAAAAPEVPGTPTGHLKLDDAAIGTFTTVANAGSVVADWARNATAGADIVVAGSGPNDMQYASSPSDSTETLVLTGKTIGDLIGQTIGLVGIIFRWNNITGTNANHLANDTIFEDSSSLVGIGSHATAPNVTAGVRGASETNLVALPYTENGWQAMVMRYERGAVNKLFAKMDTDESWGEDAITQDIFSVAGGVQLLGEDGATVDLAEIVTYNTQTEELGDALMNYLIARADLGR